MSAEPNLDGALAALSETANRIADDRNTYHRVARKLLGALRCMVNDWEPEDDGGVWRRHWEEAKTAITEAEEAGL